MEYISRSNIAKMFGNQLVKGSTTDKCKKLVSWSWEMLGSLLIIMGSPLSVKSLKNIDECDSLKSIDINRQKEFTLVLDLDETLIHSDLERTSILDEEIIVKIGENIEKYYIKVRPYAREFLQSLSQLFDLVIFTAALKEYADKVIDFLDPCGFIKRRFYRDSCTKKDGVYYKDLTKVNQNLEKTFIIDNSLSGMQLNLSNGMLIKSWYNDTKDQELKKYQSMIKKGIKQGDNVVTCISAMKSKYPNNILN
ncbi:unnamed protein product (macronuclear) [Paramecium tetraurelia]|uniref:FCP1 homology domain-containing protein n=1 Tax=Paramecium tetraurelia TaxID=5888 RepID=A0DPK8_PARTE|nr:uncharacterized protein GSPATT00019157001 [Paramecium tetraurelia]CAK84975.1 unnamed protein product [Paramecium tetraurelia]|eukprot:XP_001452372.1 hypothetical protein (macronuclear) [Paramecium tetraurelia strain d4-2]